MRFRPCIDLHDGAVKQIVGSTLRDGPAAGGAAPTTNFVAEQPAAHFAALYARDALPGGRAAEEGGACAVPPAPSRDAAAAVNDALFALVLKPRMKSAAHFEEYPGAVSVPSKLFSMRASGGASSRA